MHELMLLKKKNGSSTVTWNPANKATSVTLTNGNLTANCSNVGGACFATTSKTSGKWYFEVKYTSFEGPGLYSPMLGLGSPTTALNSPWNTNTGEMLWYYGGSGVGVAQFVYAANSRFTYGSIPAQGDVIGCALDMDAKTVYYIRNGVAQPLVNYGSPNNYSGASTLYPIVASPNSQQGSTIVDWVATPQYCPAGYNLW